MRALRRTVIIQAAFVGTVLVVVVVAALVIFRDRWWGYWPQAGPSGLGILAIWLSSAAGLLGGHLGGTPGREGYRYVLRGSALERGGAWVPRVAGALGGVLVGGGVVCLVTGILSFVQVGYLDSRWVLTVTAAVQVSAALLGGFLVGRRWGYVAGITVVPLAVITFEWFSTAMDPSRVMYLVNLTNNVSTATAQEALAPALLRLGVVIAIFIACWAALRERPTVFRWMMVVAMVWAVSLGLSASDKLVKDPYSTQPLCQEGKVRLCTDRAHEAVAPVIFDELGAVVDKTPASVLGRVTVVADEERQEDPDILAVPLLWGNSASSQWVDRELLRRGFADALVSLRCPANDSPITAELRYRAYLFYGVDPETRPGGYGQTLSEYRVTLGADAAQLDSIMALDDAAFFAILAHRQSSPAACAASLDRLR